MNYMPNTVTYPAEQPNSTAAHFDFHGIGPIRQIIRKAAALTGLRTDEILSACKQRPLPYVRFGIVWVARRQDRPCTAIARVFGQDHTSVIYAERRARDLIENNPEFARYCAELAA